MQRAFVISNTKRNFYCDSRRIIYFNCCKHVEELSDNFDCNKADNHLNSSDSCLKKQPSLNSNSSLFIWHKRLAHAFYVTLQHLNSPDVSLVLNDNKKNDLQACEICHIAKQARLPFPTHTNNTSSTFELVHVDIWGPYSQPSLSGTSYMLTLVDDFSRATWTYLMQHKAQTIIVFTSFIKLVQTQFEAKIKFVRTDNGSEFLSTGFQALLSSHGILHQKSCIYTPPQNGVIE